MQRVLAQVRVVLHDLQAIGCVSLVLGGGVVVLSVFRAHHADDFSGFRFRCYCGPLLADEEMRTVQTAL